MGRPQKNNASFFSHDNDMRNDPKIRALRRKYSHKGYAVWVFMLEYLTDCEYFCVEWSDLNIELLAADFDVESDELREIANYCLTLGLLQLENGKLTCSKLKERLRPLTDKRGRKTAETTESDSFRNENPENSEFPKQKLLKNEVSASETPQIKEKKIKENKIIKNISSVEEIRADVSAEDRERIFEIFLFDKRVNPQQEFEKFENYYKSTGWVNGKGQAITDKVALAACWRAEATIDVEHANMWRAFYDACRGHPKRKSLLTDFVKLNIGENAVTVVLRDGSAGEVIEQAVHDDECRRKILAALGGAKLKYAIQRRTGI